MQKKSWLGTCMAVLLSHGVLQGQEAQVYKDAKAPVEKRVEDLLARMTLEEKIDMIGGHQAFYIRPNERLGIPAKASYC